MSGERRAIVAVFGGNGDHVDKDVLSFAEKLGGDITRRGHILLTGGDGPPDPSGEGEDEVKRRAIRGAQSRPWIGVLQSGAIDHREEHSTFIVKSGLKHKRNYLEAFLCDVAVGLVGGPGTLSEVVFALSLGRPVVLIGRDHWEKKLELQGSAVLGVVPKAMDEAEKRVGELRPRQSELDKCIKTAFQNPLKDPTTTVVVDSRNPTETGKILEWIEDHAKPLRDLESGPVFPVAEYESVGGRLLEWIEGLGPPSGSGMSSSGTPSTTLETH